MDTAFVTYVPDLTEWGTYVSATHDAPRAHTADTLDVTVTRGDDDYCDIIDAFAKAVAGARLQPAYLARWEAAVTGVTNLDDDEREIIARALARGIVESGSDPVEACPSWNASNFKGHVVEVLLYCMRVHLLNTASAHPILFQPRKPKVMSATPGIDLLELGANGPDHYFHIWECKGTTGSLSTAFNQAAAQLCDEDQTAYQSFLESHRALQDSPEIDNTPGLEAFVNEMPRQFFAAPASSEKRLGGFAGCHSNANLAHIRFFATTVDSRAHANPENCHAVAVRFQSFTHFLEDVYERLWSIY